MHRHKHKHRRRCCLKVIDMLIGMFIGKVIMIVVIAFMF